jgi:succinoglycan biosynthesis protein ExoO
MPKVSIILAVLNGEQTIRKAIESAQNQTMRDFEIVVIDDGSTDKTGEVVTAMADEDRRINYIRLPQNGGVGAARNAGLAAATGEWITILDADDWYEPNRLEVLLKMGGALHADLVADNLKIYDHIRKDVVDRTHHGRDDRPTLLTAEMFFQKDNPLRRHPMGFIQPLIRRQFIVDHKIVYDPNHRVGEDFIFVSEILLQGGRAYILPDAYYVYVHRISPTTRKISPHSHSKVNAVFALIMRGCNELLDKYSSVMTPKTRRALEKRRWIYENAVQYQDLRNALARFQPFKAVKIAITHPVVFILIWNIIAGLIETNFNVVFGSRRTQRVQTHA